MFAVISLFVSQRANWEESVENTTLVIISKFTSPGTLMAQRVFIAQFQLLKL